MVEKKCGSVQVKVCVPKGVVGFLQALSKFGGREISLKAWLEEEILGAVQATIDVIDDGDLIRGEYLRAKYGLPKRNAAERITLGNCQDEGEGSELSPTR